MANTPANQRGKGTVTDIAEARRQRESTQKQSSATRSNSKKSTGSGGRSINYEKVAALKSAIENGTYRINARRIADKFIEKESP